MYVGNIEECAPRPWSRVLYVSPQDPRDAVCGIVCEWVAFREIVAMASSGGVIFRRPYIDYASHHLLEVYAMGATGRFYRAIQQFKLDIFAHKSMSARFSCIQVFGYS